MDFKLMMMMMICHYQNFGHNKAWNGTYYWTCVVNFVCF